MPLFYSGQTDYIAKLNAGVTDTFSTSISATVGGTTTLDLSSGGSFFVTMGAGNTTLSFINVPTTAFLVVVYIKQDGVGSRTITSGPTGILWAGGSVGLSTGANKVDILEFRTVNSGTTWYGYKAAANL